ncbi:endo-1,4-beta-xylanase [Metabacillus sp. Hm71]|uniref:endo-1,4-beta-xylanase n=1 Tax=Metabacillus sp. Hm71 TaxID=3450743 RepID=UPI003F41DFD1
MKKFLFFTLLGVTIVIFVFFNLKEDEKVPIGNLRELAQKEGFYIGTAISLSPLINDPNYEEVLSEEFNIVTIENEMKFSSIHPGKNSFDFSKSDKLVRYAIDNNQKVRGHTLVWHKSIPDWLEHGDFTKEEMKKILKEHIQTVVSRYKDKVYAWDVVNEALNDDGTLRDSIWLRTIGPEYIRLAYYWAHEADPDALLFYNDYGIAGINPKSDALYSMLKDFKEDGVPISGVGYQMHTRIGQDINLRKVKKSMDRLNKIDIQTHITELDIGIVDRGSMNYRLNKQSKMYSNILSICLKTESCTALVVWGFTDKYTWRREEEKPLIFDSNFEPKDSYWSLLKIFVKYSKQTKQ